MTGRNITANAAADFDLQRALAVPFNILFFFAFMALCCRGLLEVTIGKLLAYAVQAGLWMLVQAIAIVGFRTRPTRLLTAGIFITLLFGVIAAISTQVTLRVQGVSTGLVSTVVNIYLLALFVVGYGFRTDAFSARTAVTSMSLAGVLLPVVGILQLVKIALLPGLSPGRVPSVTGSYLHFPLLAGVLGILLMEAAKQLRIRFLYPIAGLCFVGVVISGGRSGALVILATGGLYLIYEFSRKSRAQKLRFALGAFVVIAVLAGITAGVYEYLLTFVTAVGTRDGIPLPGLLRIAQLGSLQEGGNYSRILIWNFIITYWEHTNLWIGEYAGMVGNTSNNVSGGISVVAESGALQQLINFGVLGLLFFYGAMFFAYCEIEKDHSYLRALFVSAMLQTLFYQSTEVLPYMAMLAFIPAFSQSLARENSSQFTQTKADKAVEVGPFPAVSRWGGRERRP